MPRLSIIVPHRHDDQRLESTLLGILENRPADSEIIVVHDGSYADPYQLADELIFVEGEPHENTLQLINAGVWAACAPIVCTLLDGVSVSGDWADSPLDLLSDPELAAVSVGTQIAGHTSFGIDPKGLRHTSQLQRGDVELSRAKTSAAGPQLTCGFYRRKTLLALGGWDERLDLQVADVELAWALRGLELQNRTDESVRVEAEPACQRNFNHVSMKQLAELAVAYGASTGGATSAMSDLLRGCLQGHVSLAVAWAAGVMGGRATEHVAQRLERARVQLSAQPTGAWGQAAIAAGMSSQRRAA